MNEKNLFHSSYQLAEILQSSRNLLKAINSKNSKRIAEWGFNVDDTTNVYKKTKL